MFAQTDSSCSDGDCRFFGVLDVDMDSTREDDAGSVDSNKTLECDQDIRILTEPDETRFRGYMRGEPCDVVYSSGSPLYQESVFDAHLFLNPDVDIQASEARLVFVLKRGADVDAVHKYAVRLANVWGDEAYVHEYDPILEGTLRSAIVFNTRTDPTCALIFRNVSKNEEKLCYTYNRVKNVRAFWEKLFPSHAQTPEDKSRKHGNAEEHKALDVECQVLKKSKK